MIEDFSVGQEVRGVYHPEEVYTVTQVDPTSERYKLRGISHKDGKEFGLAHTNVEPSTDHEDKYSALNTRIVLALGVNTKDMVHGVVSMRLDQFEKLVEKALDNVEIFESVEVGLIRPGDWIRGGEGEKALKVQKVSLTEQYVYISAGSYVDDKIPYTAKVDRKVFV